MNGSAPPSLLDGAGDAGALALLSAANSSGASEEARRSARESLLAVARAPELPPPSAGAAPLRHAAKLLRLFGLTGSSAD